MTSLAQLSAATPGEAELSNLLEHAVARTADTGVALIALARLDTRSAAQWLLRESARARQVISPQQLADSLGAIADAATLDTLLKELLLQLAISYSDLIPVKSAVRLIHCAAAESMDIEPLLEALLRREPHNPELLRLAATAAIQRGEIRGAHALLAKLGRADPRLSTLTHISRSRAALSGLDLPPVRLAFLSSYTIDPLLPFVSFECADLGLAAESYIAPFNSWAQETLDPASGLFDFAPEVIFLALALDDLIPELAGAPPAAQLEALGQQALERVLAAAQRCAVNSDALIVVHGFFSAYRDPLGAARSDDHISRSAWIGRLNDRLEDALRPLQQVRVLDVQDALIRRTDGPLENAKMRHYASMRLSERVLGEIARSSAGYIAARKGLTRKCVVLDLDNTLWGGVVGEEGPHGIKLGNTSPGSEYLELQRYLKSLSERGILLAINSKNNPDDAREALRHNEAMLLREDAFSAIRMNWSPKPDNMREIARELNIGLDSLIFIDDNPHERELMRQTLPEVLTPELPADPALYRSVLETLPQLQMLGITEEDRKRAELYRSGKQREATRESAVNLEEYLHSLGIVAEVEPASDKTLPRVHQLFQRTNQFNVTTRRYDSAELRAAATAAAVRLYTLHARDRFGDHGLVAVALVRLEQRTWRIDSLLMSCRVIGYGIETALLGVIGSDAQRDGGNRLLGEFIATAKNKPAQDIYEKHGFTPAGEADGVQLWEFDLQSSAIATPAWISIQEKKHDPREIGGAGL